MSYKFTKRPIQESIPPEIDSPFMIFPQAKMIIEAVGVPPKVDPQALAFVRAVEELKALLADSLEPSGYALLNEVTQSTENKQGRRADMTYRRVKDAVSSRLYVNATRYKDIGGGAAIVEVNTSCSGETSPYPYKDGGRYGINWDDSKFEDKLKACLADAQKVLDEQAAACKAEMDARAKQMAKMIN